MLSRSDRRLPSMPKEGTDPMTTQPTTEGRGPERGDESILILSGTGPCPSCNNVYAHAQDCKTRAFMRMHAIIRDADTRAATGSEAGDGDVVERTAKAIRFRGLGWGKENQEQQWDVHSDEEKEMY